MNKPICPGRTMWVANRYGVASTKLKDFVWVPAPAGGPYDAQARRNGQSRGKRTCRSTVRRPAPSRWAAPSPTATRILHEPYILRRIATGLVMLVALSMLVFVLLRLAPGDPIDAYIDPSVPMSSAELAAMRARLGLDQPLPVQYLAWMRAAAIRRSRLLDPAQRREPVLALLLGADRPYHAADGPGSPSPS